MTLLSAWSSLPDAERRARCRALQAIVRLLAGPRCPAVEPLRQAEDDAGALAEADRAMEQLPTRTYRSALCTFAATLPTKGEVLAGLRTAISPQETRSSVSPLPRGDKTHAGER